MPAGPRENARCRESAGAEVSWSLIARAATGDGAARSVFGRSYLPVVRGFLAARWRGTPLLDEVDDAVQEVFVECLRDGGVLSRAAPERGDLRGLLFGVTRKVAARFEQRWRRRRAGDQASGSVIEIVQAREASLSVWFDRQWARTLMRLAGERMRRRAARTGCPDARLRVELLELRFQDGLPIRDIAARWQRGAAAVHRAYARARDEFRACLRQVVAEHVVRSEAALDHEIARVLALLG